MTEVKRLWPSALPRFPEADIERIFGFVSGELAQAAACFWLFRYLHRFPGADEALFGDYCFGRFSAHLAALDNVPLNDAFAAFLRRDTLKKHDFEEYLAFVELLPGQVAA